MIPSHTTVFVSPKGGQGCSTVAALTAAAMRRPVALVAHDVDDIVAILGGYHGLRDFGDIVVHSLDEFNAGSVPVDMPVIIDGGTNPPGCPPGECNVLLVMRNCFLSLRRALHLTYRPDGIVLIAEPGRALSTRDLTECTGVPVVAELPFDGTIARAVDAGTMLMRAPRVATRTLAPLMDGVPA